MTSPNAVVKHPYVRQFLASNRLSIVDGGSRGNLFEPFDGVDSSLLTVLRFEPDPGAEIVKSDGEVIFNKGLWNEEATISLNLAKVPTTSSVYPPNKPLLLSFNDRVGLPPRTASKVLDIDAISIDAAVQQANIPNVDFIKLDIHGAEYEAVMGATNSLANTCVGLLVEAWTVEVHKGQKLVFDLEAELSKHGFFKVGETQAINWPKKGPAGIKSKPQQVAEENLYLLQVHTVDDVKALGAERAMKLAVAADLFRHTTYALQLFDLMGEAGFIPEADAKSIRSYIVSKNKVTTVDKLLVSLIHRLKTLQDKRL